MTNINFIHYKALLKAMRTETTVWAAAFNIGKKQNKQKNLLNESKGKKIGGKILGGALCLIMLAYLCTSIITYTLSAIQGGYVNEIPYFILGLAQFLVLLMGTGAAFSYIYFSNDNILLQSLPIKSSVIFLAKLSMAYLSQLVISLVILLPSLITFGIVCTMNGIAIKAGFYVYAVLTPFISPLIPLLVVCLLSIPVMFFMSLIKNRAIAKGILSIVLTLGILIIYFAFIFSMTSVSDDTINISSGNYQLVNFVSRIAIFNYFWVEAMMGNSIALNTLYYVLISIGALALSIALTALCYKRNIAFSLENSSGSKKHKRAKKSNGIKNYSAGNFFKSFFIKDLKSMFAEPTLLINTGLGIVITAIMICVFGGLDIMNFSETGEVSYGSELCTLGFLSYMVTIMSSSSNTIALVGFSLEGSNFSLLKTLPIKPKDIVISKLIVSNLYTAFISLEFFVIYSIVCKMPLSPIAGLLAGLLVFVTGFGVSCLGLYNDIKAPTLNYSNMLELTKNNKRTIKPMLCCLAFGLIYMISGIVLGILLENQPLIAYLIFFAVFFLVVGIFALVCFKKLWNNIDELYDKIEA